MTLQQLRYVVMVETCGSINEAARKLFISQPSLSSVIKEIEEEIQSELFIRSNRGIKVTPQGEEFMSYARQVIEQYNLLKVKFVDKKVMDKFSVSTQHYSFAISAFVEVVKKVGLGEYDFAIYETKTYEVIENVRNFKSELGVLYITDYNKDVMLKLFNENNLEFIRLFDCDTYVYLSKSHPLSNNKVISMEQLREYPCLAFDQGKNNSLYLAEEMKSTYDYKRIIKANDRATMLNLMDGLDGYTLCSGIINDKLNGDNYISVPLLESELMTIGYVKRKDSNISKNGELYIEELKKYEDNIMRTSK